MAFRLQSSKSTRASLPQSSKLTRASSATLLVIWLAVSRGANARRLPSKILSQPQERVPKLHSQSPPKAQHDSQEVPQTPLESMETILQSEHPAQPVSLMQMHQSHAEEEAQTQEQSKQPGDDALEALEAWSLRALTNPQQESHLDFDQILKSQPHVSPQPQEQSKQPGVEAIEAVEAWSAHVLTKTKPQQELPQPQGQSKQPHVLPKSQPESLLKSQPHGPPQSTMLKTKILPQAPADGPLQLYAPDGAISAEEDVTTLGTLTLALERSAFSYRVALVLLPVLLAIVALVCAQSGRKILGKDAKRQMLEDDAKKALLKKKCSDKNCPACAKGYKRGSRDQSPPGIPLPPPFRSQPAVPASASSLVGPKPEPATDWMACSICPSSAVNPSLVPEASASSTQHLTTLSSTGSLLCLDGDLTPHPEQRTVTVSRVEDGATMLRVVVDEVGRKNPSIRVETVKGTAPAVMLDTRHALRSVEDSSSKTTPSNSNRFVVLHRVGTAFDDPGVPCACVRPAGGGTFTVHRTAGPGLDEKRVALTVVTTGSPRVVDSMMDEQGLVAMQPRASLTQSQSDLLRPSGSGAAMWVRHGADVALVTSLALAVQKLS